MSALNYVTLAIFVVFFNLIQWLTAPYLIDRMYRIKEVSRNVNPQLYGMVEELSKKSGIKAPTFPYPTPSPTVPQSLEQE